MVKTQDYNLFFYFADFSFNIYKEKGATERRGKEPIIRAAEAVEEEALSFVIHFCFGYTTYSLLSNVPFVSSVSVQLFPPKGSKGARGTTLVTHPP